MKKFECTVCGYIYDEAVGIPENGIAPGTKFETLADDFECPLCGASKQVFEQLQSKGAAKSTSSGDSKASNAAASASKSATEKNDIPVGSKNAEVQNQSANKTLSGYERLNDLSASELTVLFSNLANGCAMQHLSEESKNFLEISEFYKQKQDEQSGTIKDLAQMLGVDVDENLPSAKESANLKGDRGALRALVWSEKVSKMLKSLLDRYEKNGNALLESTKIHVCDICGFVYVGEKLPEICPVCKVPNFKISEIQRR